MKTNWHNPLKHRKRAPYYRFGLLLLALALPSFAQQRNKALSEMTLEDLMNVEVTSVAKHEQPLSETAAAVYVITQEDVRRSGAANIPEALRLAPGVEVAQINAHTWAISIRGFNYRYANKLLVLIDGRVVYTPLFSGTLWNLEDVMLEDVERIEVIRGPGASLWGANAVNGVINIITKPARETQGGLLTATGSDRWGYSAARYGSRASKNFVYRVFGKYSQLSPYTALPVSQSDAFLAGRAGLRADWTLTPADSITLSGDVFRGLQNEAYTMPLLAPPYNLRVSPSFTNDGGDFLTRWHHRFGNNSESTLQFFFDRADYAVPTSRFKQNVYDFDFQYQVPWGERQELMWGAGYRQTTEDLHGSFLLSFSPHQQNRSQPVFDREHLFNGFVQDEVTLIPSRLMLTLGSKFESNRYTGFEYQPSARLHWQAQAHQALWLSVSRAVRTPSDYEENSRIAIGAQPGPGGLIYLPTLFGNPALRSEQLLAYEAGYRIQPVRRLSLDMASFYNIYHRLIGQSLSEPYLELTPAPPHVVIPLQFDNNHDGKSYGLELTASYIPLTSWKITGSYSWLHMRFHPADVSTSFPVGSSPSHSFQAHSYLSLRQNFEFDNGFYWVDRLSGQPVPPYLRVDTRLAWHPQERLELSVSGQNLLRPQHPEFILPIDIQGAAQVSRTVSAKITWQF